MPHRSALGKVKIESARGRITGWVMVGDSNRNRTRDDHAAEDLYGEISAPWPCPM